MRRGIRQFKLFLGLSVLVGGGFSCTQNSNVSRSAPDGQSVRKQNGALLVSIPPNESGKNLRQLEKAISEKISEPVKIKVVAEYKDLISDLKNKKAHFAVLPPLVAVKAEREAQIKFLLKKVYGDSDFYFSAVITLAESPLKSLSELKGKKVAFVDPNSSSGYLYPKLMFSEAGVKESDLLSSFSGKHDKSVEMLLEKKVDAVAVWADDPKKGTGAWTDTKLGKRFKVIQYSEPIPNDAIVALEDFYKQNPAKVLKFMEALIYISEEMSILKEVFGVDSLTTATSAHYENVRKLEKIQ